jgi:serine/threonine-protein kinase HipA
MRLAVELYDSIVGTLNGDARTFDFAPSGEGIDRLGADRPGLSVVIPLAPSQRRRAS